MMRYLARIRSIIIVALTILIVAGTPALAQQLGPDGAPNPTASVASEQTATAAITTNRGTDRPAKREGACSHATRRAAMGSFP